MVDGAEVACRDALLLVLRMNQQIRITIHMILLVTGEELCTPNMCFKQGKRSGDITHRTVQSRCALAWVQRLPVSVLFIRHDHYESIRCYAIGGALLLFRRHVCNGSRFSERFHKYYRTISPNEWITRCSSNQMPISHDSSLATIWPKWKPAWGHGTAYIAFKTAS